GVVLLLLELDERGEVVAAADEAVVGVDPVLLGGDLLLGLARGVGVAPEGGVEALLFEGVEAGAAGGDVEVAAERVYALEELVHAESGGGAGGGSEWGAPAPPRPHAS